MMMLSRAILKLVLLGVAARGARTTQPAAAEEADETRRSVQEQGLRLVAATGVLFHGMRYAQTMLFFHTLKMTAGPLLGQAFGQVRAAYAKARAEARDTEITASAAAEALRENKGKIGEVRSRMTAARSRYRRGEMTRDELLAYERTQREALLSVLSENDVLRAASSRFRAFVAALDGDKLKSLGVALYAATAAAVASATSKTAAVAAIGLNIGKQAATTIRGVVLPVIKRLKGIASRELDLLPPTARKYVQTGATAAGAALGVILAYAAQRTALAVATVYFASGAILKVVSELAPDLIQPDTPAFSTLHVGIAAFGLAAQILRPRPPHFLLRLLFKPFDLLEAYLRALTLYNMRSGAPSLF